MKAVMWGVLVGCLVLHPALAQTALRGSYFGRTSLSSPSSPDLFPTMVGTIQQTINDFRFGDRGAIRSSMMVVSNDGGAMSAWDVLRVKGRRLTMQTTFQSPCGCGSGEVVLRGRAKVMPRAISYSAVSADGNYSLRGTIRVKRNRMARVETRTTRDPDFDETDSFRFASSLFLQGRSGR